MTTVTLTITGQNTFDASALQADADALRARSLDTIQVNIGLRCNLACRHCHVESSPARQEQMSWATMQAVLAAAQLSNAHTLDITGGAPEMHPHFRAFVAQATTAGLRVIVRTNLTILLEDGYTDLPDFYAQHRVHLIASLPCYLPTNVDRQRGRHVYRDSIEAIRLLNEAGYAANPALKLDLVYNPGGASLPPSQEALEQDYRRVLSEEYDISFTRLITITNMAIGRFLHDLEREGKGEAYQQLLRDAFNPATLESLMCRHQLHVGHDGTLFDCDFNFALGLPASGPVSHIRDFDPASYLQRKIVTGEHCFACTAGSGSSCNGALL